MRKAQSVVKFGLKLGAFVALAAALSSCIGISISNGPQFSNLVTNSTYTDGNGIQQNTRLDFSVDVLNATVKSFDAIVTAIPAEGDDGVTDPTTIPEGPLSSTKIAFVETSRISGSGTIRGYVTLSMKGNNQFLDLQSVPVVVCDIRLWVRASYGSDGLTGWLKSARIKPLRPC
jgi:hypothetical protein